MLDERIFPEKLDAEEMGIRQKEWQLLGYDVIKDEVKKNPVFSKSLMVTWDDGWPLGWVNVRIYMYDGEIWEALGEPQKRP